MYDIVRAGPAPRRGAVDRRHLGELDRIDRRAELAEEQVAAVNRVAQRAIGELTLTGMVRKEAERICPDQAEAYAMISAAAAMGSIQAINSVTRRY